MRHLCFLLFLLFFCAGSEAATLKKTTYITRAAQKNEPELKIRYTHSPSAVDLDSVCDNYPYRSIDYRNCRTAARALFREKCAAATAAFYATRTFDQVRSRERDKWCDAGVQFQP
jgi:hypothetical protein